MLEAAMSRIEEWIKTAVGQEMNPDNAYGWQCKDVIDHYAQYLWPGKSWLTTVGANDAEAVFASAPSAFWSRVANNPASSSQLPPRGAVLVWDGWQANPFGHIAVVERATQTGVHVIQQDGFQQVAAHRKFWGWTQLPVMGWLIPKQVMTIERREPVIADTINHFSRCRKAMMRIRGRDLSRAEFRKKFVGNNYHQMLVALLDNPEADTWYSTGLLGKQAKKDNWSSQIKTLKGRADRAEAALRAAQSAGVSPVVLQPGIYQVERR